MKRIITIANQKGGVAKTTTAINLGHGMALRGKTVLIVDADPQGQVATFLGLPQESGLFDMLIALHSHRDVTKPASLNGHERPRLTLIPGNKRTATAQTLLATEGFPLTSLATALRTVKADYIIIDTSPSVGLLQEAAIHAADYLLIPCSTDYAATEGLAHLITTLSSLQQRGSDCQLLAILPTFYDKVTNESRITLELLETRFRHAVWSPIHRATILRESAAAGLTIFEHAPTSRAAIQYHNLVTKVLTYD